MERIEGSVTSLPASGVCLGQKSDVSLCAQEINRKWCGEWLLMSFKKTRRAEEPWRRQLTWFIDIDHLK